MECAEKIEHLEQEHNQMGNTDDIHAQRTQVKEKMRDLEKEVERLGVRHLFSIPLATVLRTPAFILHS